MKILPVVRRGNVLAVELPSVLEAPVETALTYAKVVRLTGHDAWVARREGNSIYQSERVRCYRYEASTQRMVFRLGLFERFAQIVAKRGYEAKLEKWEAGNEQKILVPNWTRLHKSFPKLEYMQREALQMFIDHPCGRVECPPAWGKSTLIVMLCLLLDRAKIEIVVEGTSLISQLYNKLLSYFPGVGRIDGSHKIFDERVTIISSKSLGHSNFNADIVLGDECHTLGAPKVSSDFANYLTSRIYGLSANQTREDNSTLRLEQLFGPVRIKVNRKVAEANNTVIRTKVLWVQIPATKRNPCESINRDDTVEMARAGIWTNQFRNEILAAAANHFFNKGDHVMVSTRTVTHIAHLKKFLPCFAMVHAVGALKHDDRLRYIAKGLLTGNEPEVTRQYLYEIEAKFRDGEIRGVIANSVWDKGMDFETLNVLVRTEGAASKILSTQLPGRTGRIDRTKGSGKQYSLIIDAWDEWDSSFFRKSKTRYKHYEAQGFEQIMPFMKAGVSPLSVELEDF